MTELEDNIPRPPGLWFDIILLSVCVLGMFVTILLKLSDRGVEIGVWETTALLFSVQSLRLLKQILDSQSST